MPSRCTVAPSPSPRRRSAPTIRPSRHPWRTSRRSTWRAPALPRRSRSSAAPGRYREAEPLFTRALAIQEKTRGPQHPAVSTTLNELGELYRAQARWAEAEPLYRRSLAIRERVFGPESSSVAVVVANLGLLD